MPWARCTRYAGADGDDHADDDRQPAHHHVVAVGAFLVDERLVDVVGPHGGEGAYVARHAAHEAGDQRGDAQAQQAGAEVANHHQRQRLVVAVQLRAGSPAEHPAWKPPGAWSCRHRLGSRRLYRGSCPGVGPRCRISPHPLLPAGGGCHRDSATAPGPAGRAG